MRKPIIVGCVLISMTALAGKRERDLKTNEVIPAINDAEAKWQASCGCKLAITLDDNVDGLDELRSARNTAQAISEGVPGYCTDAGSKKALCQMKTLAIAKGEPGFTYKNGHGTAIVAANTHPGFEMITQAIDK